MALQSIQNKRTPEARELIEATAEACDELHGNVSGYFIIAWNDKETSAFLKDDDGFGEFLPWVIADIVKTTMETEE